MTGALGRGIHIPPMRLVEWPDQLVESPHFLKYVLEHVSAEDAALGWQDSDGCTVTMRIVSIRDPSPEYVKVQRLWLEKWSPAECCSQLQDKNGRTVAMHLAICGKPAVHRLWLEKWSPSECCSTCRTRMVALWPCTSLDMGSPMCRGCG